MSKSIEEKLKEIEGQIMAGWQNETIRVFFNGTNGIGEEGILYISSPFDSNAASAVYRVLIKEDVGYIRVILNFGTNKPHVWEYKILAIDSQTLTLESPFDGPIVKLSK